jgi:hypothetical protein
MHASLPAHISAIVHLTGAVKVPGAAATIP